MLQRIEQATYKMIRGIAKINKHCEMALIFEAIYKHALPNHTKKVTSSLSLPAQRLYKPHFPPASYHPRPSETPYHSLLHSTTPLADLSPSSPPTTTSKITRIPQKKSRIVCIDKIN